ncbi:dystroglycan-related [Anaeramoeba flamelloides]|uniref:Dystroglycan-related n=1 Tax=Anaeramoeba flamelloides TaxID=1746091 RepID=A0AAV7YPD8_9EUKA|nr:dystroglycan-related [Anaeramoeba flamelloides]
MINCEKEKQLCDSGSQIKINTNEKRNGKVSNTRVEQIQFEYFVSIWNYKSDDGLVENLYGQVFFQDPQIIDQQPSKVGSKFKLGQDESYKYSVSSVTAITNGNFVVMYQPYNETQKSGNIVSQVFTFRNSRISKLGTQTKLNNLTQDLFSTLSSVFMKKNRFCCVWESIHQTHGMCISVQVMEFDEQQNKTNKIGDGLYLNTGGGDTKQFNPEIDLLDDQNIIVVWVDESDGKYNIFGQILNITDEDDTPLKIGQVFQINEDSLSQKIKPVVLKINNNRTFVVIYENITQPRQGETSETDGHIIIGKIFYFNGVSSTIKIKREFIISTNENYNHTNPRVSYLYQNKFIVVWESKNMLTQKNYIFSRVINIEENNYSMTFDTPKKQLNENIFKFQNNPDIVSLSPDDFTCAWESISNDNTSVIFGKRIRSYENNSPYRNGSFPELIYYSGTNEKYQFGDAIFVDADNDKLSYSSNLLINSDPLPDWINFTPEIRHFEFSIPKSQCSSLWQIIVIASDHCTSTNNILSLQIINQNPKIVDKINNQVLYPNQDFEFRLPSTSFIDPENDTLKYYVYQNYNETLPKWLNFDNQSLSFHGETPGNLIGILMISVIAVDKCSNTNSQNFEIEIIDNSDTIVIEPKEDNKLDAAIIVPLIMLPLGFLIGFVLLYIYLKRRDSHI